MRWIVLCFVLGWALSFGCDPASSPQEPTKERSQTEPQQQEVLTEAGGSSDASIQEPRQAAEPSVPEMKSEPPPEPIPEPTPEPVQETQPEPRKTVQCPTPAQGQQVGTRLGQYFVDTTLRDCDGNPVKLNDLCPAKATWISFHHGWCPHCRKLRDEMESIHTSYDKDGLVSIAILVQTSSRTAPTPEACKQWKQSGNFKKVMTLYDPTFATRKYWEQNYTALNMFLSENRVVSSKFHSDRESDLRAAIVKALKK